MSTKGVHGDLASCPVSWRHQAQTHIHVVHRHIAVKAIKALNCNAIKASISGLFQLLKIMYRVPRYTNCDNQPRFEECWVRSGIQHEKQSLENLLEKILHVCAHVTKETPLSPGLGTKQKDLLNKYFQVEIDRRMVDFIVGLDSEMQQLVDACSKTGGLKQRTLNF